MTFKYQQLATHVTGEIQNQTLAAGEPLPALRKFALQHQVSLATATKTYEWLQSQGLIVAKAQSGFYVKGHSSIKPLSQPRLKSVSIKHDPSDVIFEILQNALTFDRVGLSSGYLDESLRPSLELQRSLKRTAKIANLTANSYGHTQGEVKLRNAIVDIMRQRQCSINTEQIIVTNGCLEAINLVLGQVSEVGDTVAIFTPCYSGLLTALKHAKRQVLEIPCGPEGPDMVHVAELFSQGKFTTLLFSAIASNPIGFSLPRKTKKQLALLAKQYQTYIIEDDTFGSLDYRQGTTEPAYAYDHAGYIVYCSSFSKDLAPNMRLGWIASKPLMPGLMRHKVALNITCNMPCQLAMADYLFSESYSAHIRKLTTTLQQQVLKLQTCVLQHFPAGTRVSQPQGGFFLWVELPHQIKTMEIYNLAVQENICFMPGHTFSMSGQYEHCLRLSINQIWHSDLEQAVCRLGEITCALFDGI
ncbi:PLP-dependent aminotransferase family protein [Paraglaciecola sp. L3A3]|uniref:aminotransferase-like domain-containing protein n=1 Tax=Paraglaciecola sp. L3A3 TaxID=2686358 RepID=UPI00131BA033|nr:PLP-dependent aminotransferase family protein [Paraglaciecola sp. L3A3]